jgi:mono/diheme cytochrome c family protein
MRRRTTLLLLACGTLTGAATLASAVLSGGLIPTTLADFSQPGTQSGDSISVLYDSQVCAGCHGYYNQRKEPYRRWASSMMAQSSRDPVFLAALAIAEQDADFAGDLCWRCHAPNGWLAGRADPTDGSALNDLGDKDGVACHLCHRMVDPVFDADSPAVDQSILDALSDPPVHEVGNGQYVVDPEDRRRGPYELTDFFLHQWIESPFHRDSRLCATCHDVSNPIFERQPDGTFALGALDQPHPTDDKRDQFPLERTYGEWSASDYALAPIETDGRFGGIATAVQSCQDCHMPDTKGAGALPGMGSVHDDLAQHDLNGANSWVLRAVHRMHPEGTTGLTDKLVNLAVGRNLSMLRRAADLDVFLRDGELVARVVNQTGHKLPTGYGEGRRMWLGVRFYDAVGDLIGEYGAYDEATATLSLDTRVYEIKHGIGPAVAAATGLSTGPSFHFVLNNVIELDNRVPPRGYEDETFAGLGAPVVGHVYPDEHYWDDAAFPIPAGAVDAEVDLWHQTTTREYAEFLRDENTTTADGQVAYDLWVSLGKSAPSPMGTVAVNLDSDPAPRPISYGLAVRAGNGEIPELSWSGTPEPGGAFTLEVTHGPAGVHAFLLQGDVAQRSALPSGGWKLVGGNVLTAASGVLDAQGAVSFPVSVPPGIGGEMRYYQVLLRDPGSPGDVAATPAVFVELGD